MSVAVKKELQYLSLFRNVLTESQLNTTYRSNRWIIHDIRLSSARGLIYEVMKLPQWAYCPTVRLRVLITLTHPLPLEALNFPVLKTLLIQLCCPCKFVEQFSLVSELCWLNNRFYSRMDANQYLAPILAKLKCFSFHIIIVKICQIATICLTMVSLARTWKQIIFLTFQSAGVVIRNTWKMLIKTTASDYWECDKCISNSVLFCENLK